MDPGTTTIDMFRNTTADQFENQVDQLWTAVTELKDAVVTQVRNEAIPPMTGLGILSCITAQAFSYGVFHGEPTSADLVRQLGDRAFAASR